MEEIVNLAQYGATGIIIALILVVAWVLREQIQINKRQTDTMDRSFAGLKAALDNNTKVIEDYTQVSREIKDAINGCKYNHR